jgi:hypothetical protein
LNVRIGRCEDGSFHFKGLAHNPWADQLSLVFAKILQPQTQARALQTNRVASMLCRAHLKKFAYLATYRRPMCLNSAWTAKILQGSLSHSRQSPSHQRVHRIAADHRCERPLISFAHAKTVHVRFNICKALSMKLGNSSSAFVLLARQVTRANFTASHATKSVQVSQNITGMRLVVVELWALKEALKWDLRTSMPKSYRRFGSQKQLQFQKFGPGL